MDDSTVSNLIASLLVTVSILYLTLYGVTLFAIAKSKELMQLPCYRIMVALGLFDVVQLVFLGLFPAIDLFTNSIGDSVNKAAGAILMCGWFGAMSLATMLAINRLVTVYTGSNSDNIFSGKRVFIWIGVAIAYAMGQLVYYNMPNVGFTFTADWHCWIALNTTESADATLMEIVSDSSMVITMVICYICIGVLLKAKRKSTNAKKLTKNDTRALLSAFLVAANTVALDAYFYISGAVTDATWVFDVAHFNWLITVGNNAIYYVAFNPTVRSAIVEHFPKVKNLVAPVPSVSQGNRSSNKGTTLTKVTVPTHK